MAHVGLWRQSFFSISSCSLLVGKPLTVYHYVIRPFSCWSSTRSPCNHSWHHCLRSFFILQMCPKSFSFLCFNRSTTYTVPSLSTFSLRILLLTVSSSLKITNRSFRYAALCLWNELPTDLREPRQTVSFTPITHGSSVFVYFWRKL